MSSLFELTGEFLRLMNDLDEIEEGVPTESTLELLAQIEQDIKNKADGYCSLIRHYQSQATALDDEMARLAKRAASKTSKAKWLKDRLKAALEAIGESKIETTLNTIRIAKNGGSQPVKIEVSPEHLPEQYRQVVYQPNKDLIREALQAGQSIPGCQLEQRGTHLRLN